MRNNPFEHDARDANGIEDVPTCTIPMAIRRQLRFNRERTRGMST